MAPLLPLPPPRDAQLVPSARLFQCVLLIGGAASCVIFAVIGGHDAWKVFEYDRDRREAIGIVTATSSKNVSDGKGGSMTVYAADFQFTDDSGVDHTGKAAISAEHFNELKPGLNVPVIYLSSTPGSVQWLYSDADRRGSKGQLWRGALFGAMIIVVVFGYLIWQIRDELQLARIAVATHGTVKEVKVMHGSRGPKGWRIAFEFISADGLAQKAGAMAPVTISSAVPEKGASVVVLYDHRQPRRNRLLVTLRYVDKDSLFEVKTACEPS